MNETHTEREPEYDLVRDDMVRDRAEGLSGDLVDPEHAAGRHEEPAVEGCGEQKHELPGGDNRQRVVEATKGRFGGPCTCA